MSITNISFILKTLGFEKLVEVDYISTFIFAEQQKFDVLAKQKNQTVFDMQRNCQPITKQPPGLCRVELSLKAALSSISDE